MKPLVSVVIPTYGGNPSIQQSIDSVLQQKYDRFEIIVVDDNDPKSKGRSVTESLMKKYKNEQRVTYIKHEKNKNGAAARNTGVKASKGTYIALLDDDDRFFPDKLGEQVAYLEKHPEHGAVYCWRYQAGSLITSTLEGDLSREILDLSFTPYTSSIMIRANCYQALNGFDESFRRHQDFEFLLRFFERYTIGVVKKPLVEIIGNSVNNQPKGEKDIELKKQFLSTFQDTIDRLDRETKGFKKRVWAVHYAALAVSLTIRGHFILLVKSYIQDGYKGGIIFWNKYLGRMLEILKYQFTKRMKRGKKK